MKRGKVTIAYSYLVISKNAVVNRSRRLRTLAYGRLEGC